MFKLGLPLLFESFINLLIIFWVNHFACKTSENLRKNTSHNLLKPKASSSDCLFHPTNSLNSKDIQLSIK